MYVQMTREPVTITKQTTIADALELMHQTQYQKTPGIRK